MVIWQDVVLTLGSAVFVVALVPMVLSSDKPPLTTSLPTGLVLLAFAGTYASLGAVYGAATTAVSGLLWLTLAAQKRYIESAGPFNPTSGGI